MLNQKKIKKKFQEFPPMLLTHGLFVLGNIIPTIFLLPELSLLDFGRFSFLAFVVFSARELVISSFIEPTAIYMADSNGDKADEIRFFQLVSAILIASALGLIFFGTLLFLMSIGLASFQVGTVIFAAAWLSLQIIFEIPKRALLNTNRGRFAVSLELLKVSLAVLIFSSVSFWSSFSMSSGFAILAFSVGVPLVWGLNLWGRVRYNPSIMRDATYFHLSYARAKLPSSVMQIILTQAPISLLAVFHSMAAVGSLRVLVQVSNLARFPLIAVRQTIHYRIKSARPNLRVDIFRKLNSALIVYLTIYFMIIAASSPILPEIIGITLYEYSATLTIFLAATYISSLVQKDQIILDVSGNPLAYTIAISFATIIVSTLALYIVPEFSIIGVGLCNLTAVIITKIFLAKKLRLDGGNGA